VVGVFVALLVCCAAGWFLALPRFHDQIEDDLSRVLSTEVAREIDAQAPSAGVQAGEYRISMADVQDRILTGTENLTLEGLVVRSEGDQIVLGFDIQNADATYRFTPRVSPEGYLDMSDIEGDGGIVRRLLGPESVGNAIETSVNNYLQANGLYLQDVVVEGDDIVLRLGNR
jgi:hypothetical protein